MNIDKCQLPLSTDRGLIRDSKMYLKVNTHFCEVKCMACGRAILSDDIFMKVEVSVNYARLKAGVSLQG